MSLNHQFEISEPPTDGVSSVVFAHHKNHLLASSWDRKVYLYDVNNNVSQTLTSYEHKAAVLDCAFSDDDSAAYSGSIDGELLQMDVGTGRSSLLGQHAAGIRCVEYSDEGSVVVTGSWDKFVSLWDPRAHDPRTGTYEQPDKVYALALSGYRLVLGTASRQVLIYDVRNMAKPQQRRISNLKHQTRCIRSHRGESYILSSTEGRVAVEFFDPSPEAQKRKYAFKCHRQANEHGQQIVYPVNSITFHPVWSTFATGGCDGYVNVWDGENKKRICQLRQYPTSISSINFNFDGSLLAVASSYTWEQGEISNAPRDKIFIRNMRDIEVKPKPRR